MSGDLDIANATEQAPGLRFRKSLCSCGLSDNKPYCDGTHRQADVDKSASLPEPGAPLEQTGGILSITPAENGPLRISGNMTITIKGGDTSWSGTQTALCRCGLSARKPFCDGSHRTSEFKS